MKPIKHLRVTELRLLRNQYAKIKLQNNARNVYVGAVFCVVFNKMFMMNIT